MNDFLSAIRLWAAKPIEPPTMFTWFLGYVVVIVLIIAGNL